MEKTGFCSLDSEIKKTEQEIAEVEITEDINRMDTINYSSLNALYNKFSTLQRQNSMKWAQRARLLLVQSGDYNTSFFHNSIRIRNHVISIMHISDYNCNCFTDRFGIESIFINFFFDLWKDPNEISFNDVFHALPDDLPFVDSKDRDMLIKEVTK